MYQLQLRNLFKERRWNRIFDFRKRVGFLAVSFFTAASLAQSHKGISFQGVIKLPNGEYPTRAGLTVDALVLSPNGCILREEQFTNVNISNGYINLAIGTGVAGGYDPGLSFKQVMDNSTVISSGPSQPAGLTCLLADGSVNGAVTSYNPASGNGARKFRLSVTIDSVPIVADFNMRSVAYAINAESLNGRTENSFVNVSANITQTAVETWFASTVMGQLIANTYNAPTATTIVGTVAANKVTGLATVATSGSYNDLSNKPTIPSIPSQTGNGGKYLTTDGSALSWATVAGGGSGTITEVVAGTGLSGGGTTGSVTVNLSNVGTAGTFTKVTTDAQGRVTSGTTLSASDIPALDVAKITSGTFTDSFLAGLSVDKLLNGAGKYLNYKPNNIACSDSEVLKYDSTLNAGSGGWKCATDNSAGAPSDASYAAKGIVQFNTNATTSGMVVSSGVASVNMGTGASQIVQLNSSAELPPVSAVNLTNLNATQLASGQVPYARLPVGTAVNTVAAGDDSRFSNSRTPTGSAGGDLSGTYPNPTVAKVQNIAVSSTAPLTDQVYKFDGTSLVPVYFGIDDLRTSVGASQFATSCTASQTLTWSAVTDAFTCSNIAGLNASVITGGTIDSARLPASATYWSAATGGIEYSGGNVGLGVASPSAKLDVDGQIRAKTNDLNGATTVDWHNGNIQYTGGSNGCASFTLNNMLDGASYTLAVNGTSGSCTFTAYSGNGTGALTVNYAGGTAPDAITAKTVFTFMRTGSDVFVTWVSF
ncbi:hypothetical protein [Bdellovibrio sp. ArHS]|uniref:hypothetical protein n=1 Tax=Bdellovibrio sp. ArHS TaxID=1569284 RepID=UPI000A7DFB36|nr:hypothetical protein [Bdellovibrio sp. ArHS]